MLAMTAANLVGSPGQRRQSQDGRAPESEDDWPMRQVDGEGQPSKTAQSIEPQEMSGATRFA
jgi:hypothetical protein